MSSSQDLLVCSLRPRYGSQMMGPSTGMYGPYGGPSSTTITTMPGRPELISLRTSLATSLTFR
eukprot:1856303-Amphidinium_carterae.1